MIRLFALGALSLLLTLNLATQALAAPYLDTSHPLGTVTYTNISDLNGLFMQPTQTVNTLTFSPNGFQTTCSNGACGGVASVTDTVVFRVDANPGNFIDDIVLSESGDANLTEFLAGAIGISTVTADVFIDVLEVNGSAVAGVSASSAMVFTSGGDYTLADEGDGLHAWSGNLTVDLDAVLASYAINGSATLVEISIANTLTATSSTGAIASIEKKDVSGLSITVVPEPGTALLLGLGLAALAAGRREH